MDANTLDAAVSSVRRKLEREQRLYSRGTATTPDVRRRRQQSVDLRATYAPLYDQWLAVLAIHDPVGLGRTLSQGPYLYVPEVEHLLPRMEYIVSLEEFHAALHQEFMSSFSAVGQSPDEHDSGPLERYAPTARDMWSLWRTWRAAHHP